MHSSIALRPAKCPVTHPGNPGKQGEDGENTELHANEAEEVDDGLLEPPCCARRVAIVAAANGFRGVGEGCKGEGAVEDFEEEHEDRDADCSLSALALYYAERRKSRAYVNG